MSKLNIVILAAGKGQRMNSDCPKVLHRLGGKPLLSHVIDAARSLNPARMIVVYGHGGDAVRQALADNPLEWVSQAEQLGTGHAMKMALPELLPGGATLVLYGDVPLISPATLADLVRIAAADRVGLLTVNLADPRGYGRILRDDRGQVTGNVEEKDASPQQREIREINTGFMVVPTDRLGEWLGMLSNRNAQGEYYLTDVIALAVGSGCKVDTCQPAHEWEVKGINSKQQLAELERQFQKNQAARLLEAGVTLRDPERFDLRGEIQCGRDVEIDVNCIFEGHVVLGDRVKVGGHCVIRDAVIAADTEISPFTLIDQSEVAENCRLGPFARLRPGTKLNQDAHIGNFVELKNSSVDQGSKINHLSYVGDATVGKRVNVGAGTITCNYDGADKYRTVIEDDAFIGSDTQLVAPVTVGKGATIGAGSTITKDAPESTLSLSRSKQLTVPGWKRPVKATR